MRRSILIIIGLCLLTACGKQAPKESNFRDDVKEALASSGHIDLDSLQWTREPAEYEVKGDTILITTAPHTDLWQRTYYHFQNDNAPVLQMKTHEKFFSFVVKTDFTQSHQRFDQCGIVMYLDSENWLKGSVEYENDEFQHLGSVATNNGYSGRSGRGYRAGSRIQQKASRDLRYRTRKCISQMHAASFLGQDPGTCYGSRSFVI